jgi:transcriptional antiterminator NusG
MMRIPNQEAEWHLAPFRARIDEDNARAMRIIEDGDRRAMCEFKPGDLLEIISGPFAELCVEFRRNVREAGAPFDVIEAEVELFSQRVRFKVDLLGVKRVS